MKLSLCMIVKDEEAVLPICLESVRPVVDEMIIVDTGSTDRTIEIARSCHAQVYSFPWCDDFAVARNESLQYATGDWILVLDADEVLLPDCVPALRQAIAVPDALALTLLRQEVGNQQAPYSLLCRLFRNRSDLRFTRPYHELIDDSVAAVLQQEPHWKILELPGVAIRHTGYQAEVIAQRQKGDRARRILESYLSAHPSDAYVCNKLGALHASEGELVKAEELLQRGLQTATEAAVLYELHYHLGSLYQQMQCPQQAEAHYQQATKQAVSPRLRLSAHNNLGNLLLERGDLVGAKSQFQTLLELTPDFPIAHFNLGIVLKAMGQLGAAIEHYQQAVRLDPTYAAAYQNLGVALLKAGQVNASMAAFRQAIDLYQQQQSPQAEQLRRGLKELGFAL